ncbi:ABC transporter substrate-binding protein [Neosynechococcus sphagnicola]|uniref:ABC transporter substrate-binding protein n=1 Tax=Neosynechococcus sphagnicola TaxID=1501145 RepID=UPI000AE599ED|nr:ABC transporter substrate-binding protein [Neosynechococcus sphagnicola]
MNDRMQRRKFIQRMGQTGGLLTLGGALPFVVSACAGNVSTSSGGSSNTASPAIVPSQGLKTPGLLQWGAEYVGGAPYVFKDPQNPSQLIGFEVEIAAAIANLMGVKPAHVQTAYAQLSASLRANQFDLIMNGWEMNADREKTQIFSMPYYRYGQQIVVRSEDPRFQSQTPSSNLSLKNLDGFTVGTGLGFKAEEILRSSPQITTKVYEGNLPFDDLKQKKLDAILIDLPIAAYYVLGSGPSGVPDPALKLVGQPIYPNNYVIAFNKNSPQGMALQSQINQALEILKKRRHPQDHLSAMADVE